MPSTDRPTGRRRPLSLQLMMLTGLPLVMAIAIGAIGTLGAGGMHEKIVDVAHNQLPAVRRMTLLDMSHDGLMGCCYRALVVAEHGSKGDLGPIAADARTYKAEFAEHLAALDQLQMREPTRRALDAVRPRIDAYTRLADRLITTAIDQGAEPARELLAEFQVAFDGLVEPLENLGQRIEDDSRESTQAAVGAAAKTQAWLIGLNIAGIAVAIAFCAWSGRRLVRRITELSQAAQLVADGDLTAEPDTTGNDEIRDLAGALSQMVHSLKSTLRQVQENTAQGLAHASRMSEASRTMAERAAGQASSIEEATSSVHEIASAIATNSELLGKANELAAKSSSSTSQGRSELASVVTAMTEIDAASSEVAKVISVIDDIAFQTNLLALNAAVEAARAGEAGKGFAVVADEVRTLAQRAATAARDTSQLIEESKKRADQGVVVAERASEVFTGIEQDTVRVASLLDEMAATAAEVTSQADSVRNDLQTVAHATQGAAHDADVLATIAAESQQTVTQLRDRVNTFRT